MRSQLQRFPCSVRPYSKLSLSYLRLLPVHPSFCARYSARPRQLLSTFALVENKASTTFPHKFSAKRLLTTPQRSHNSSKITINQPRVQPSLISLAGPRSGAHGTANRQHTRDTNKRIQLQASFVCSAAAAAAFFAAVLIATLWASPNPAPNSREPQSLPELLEVMAYEVPPGRPGNLTPEQEEKLRKLWAAIFQITGVSDDETGSASEALRQKETPDTGTAETENTKKKRFGVFRKKGDSKSGTSTPTESQPSDDDKYGQTKQFHDTLAKETPESIRSTIWSMVKHDHPDALVLRFLRARKWDVEKALVMLVSTMNWRHSEMRVDDDIMKNGDAFAIDDEKQASSSTQEISKGIMDQLRMGKSFLHGTDKSGRPICVVRVRLHKQGEQCEPSLEKYTVYIIETARMVLEPPVDTACIVFDMTGFSMANMDYTPVKFMIKCFEANYPESLGTVLVHKAPWLFQGIWKIIRGWLDPVVAAKVHFTNNKAELEQFIEPGHMIEELEGEEDWVYKYQDPVPGENDKMKDTETRDQLLAAREEVVKKFEHATREWIRNSDGEASQAIKAEREELTKQLREGYWNLDPYIRARTLYDRQGVIQSGGKTDWYSPKPPAAPVAETSADDID